jgi:hypothetical protein
MFREYLRLSTLLVAVTLAGCGAPPDLATDIYGIRSGDRVMVRLRLDALGMAAPSPASFQTDVMNGANISIAGKFVRQNAMWLVVQTEREELRIAKSAILTVATQLPPAK